MKALLIIDMQKISFTASTPRFDSENVIKVINTLSDNFRQNGDKVIFIQHDGTKDGFCIPKTEDWKILSELNINSTDVIISKTVNDPFYKTELNNYLLKHNISELVITGCATDFCVDTTVKSAITNNYTVTVISNGHTTANRPNLSAKQVIDHYNWIWSEMIPINGKISVVEFNKYLNI